MYKKTIFYLSVALLIPYSFGQSANFKGKNLFNGMHLPSGSTQISLSENTVELEKIVDSDFPFDAAYQARASLKQDTLSRSRSIQDATLFKNISPSVVLVITKDGLGSGSIIGNKGEVLTNYHVVQGFNDVGIIIKSNSPSQDFTKSPVLKGKVLKVDQIRDLALIQIIEPPTDRKPIRLGDESDISVGLDVHAIGHPKGESWTYTKGIISQYRSDYVWSDKDDVEHKASVIQTQTPINAGNSGGPLLNTNGNLIGVNSFKRTDTEGLNYAVGIDDVKSFLSMKESRYAAPIKPKEKEKCNMREVYRGETTDKKGVTIVWDTKCSGKGDMDVVLPYNEKEAKFLRMDRNGDGKPDVVIFSEKRNDYWDYSIWDDNYDGKWDLIGWHKNGEIEPYKYDNYSEFMAKK
jgi:S1-C subfamily serine protease